jgi:hypothetical protein
MAKSAALKSSRSKSRSGAKQAILIRLDKHFEKLEHERILSVLGSMKCESILHVGSDKFTNQIAGKFPGSIVDNVAASNLLGLSRNTNLDRNYDVVVSTGALVELSNWNEQKIALLEMRKMISKHGRLILSERIREGLDNLNVLRANFGLAEIKANSYLPQTELVKLVQSGIFRMEYTENIGNMYSIIVDVLAEKLGYNDMQLSEVAAQLPTLGEFYACSPNFLVILKNEEEKP